MNAKIETQRVQRILTSTVMAAALMSALAACGGGWRRPQEFGRPPRHGYSDQPRRSEQSEQPR